MPDLEEALTRATAQLRARKFFEAHETLESQWHLIPEGKLRTAVQGLIQLCAGLHKSAQGQASGAEYLLSRGREKLSRCGSALPTGAARPFLKAARK